MGPRSEPEAETGPWRAALRLRARAPEGVEPFGLIAPIAALLRRADHLERTAERRAGLMIRLSGARAALWSVAPPALPWLGEEAVYLGPPERRVFTPVGARVAAPAALAGAWLAELERVHGLAPPLALVPASALGRAGDALTALDLRGSAPLASVDWRRLAAAAAR